MREKYIIYATMTEQRYTKAMTIISVLIKKGVTLLVLCVKHTVNIPQYTVMPISMLLCSYIPKCYFNRF